MWSCPHTSCDATVKLPCVYCTVLVVAFTAVISSFAVFHDAVGRPPMSTREPTRMPFTSDRVSVNTPEVATMLVTVLSMTIGNVGALTTDPVLRYLSGQAILTNLSASIMSVAR